MFTYFYNKFRPLNRTHYIKCGVNSSLHNSSCCRRSVAPWITVLSRHTLFTMRVIYKFTFVWYSLKQGTTHRLTSHLMHLQTVHFLWLWEEHTEGSWDGLKISLASACYSDSRVAQYLLWPHLVFQPIWGCGDLGSLQLPKSNSTPEGAWNIGGHI
jgi:hypothetical protein